MLELGDVLRDVDRLAVFDLAAQHEAREVLVECVHAHRRTRLQVRAQLVGLAGADEAGDRGGREHHLGRDRASAAGCLLDQRLHHHRTQRRGELGAHLRLLVRRIDVDHAVDSLRGILRVQRGEHEVAGLGRRQRRRDGLEVAHLTHEDHVGVLPQGTLQRLAEAVCIGADLALVDDAALVHVLELDRVFHRHDVRRARRVHTVDDRREGRRLARTGRPAHEHETTRKVRQINELFGQTELSDRLDLGRDDSKGGAEAALVLEDVHAEARDIADGIGEVEFERLLESRKLFSGHEALDDPADALARPHGRAGDRFQLAVDTNDRRRFSHQMQVRRALRQHRPHCENELGVDIRDLRTQRRLDLMRASGEPGDRLGSGSRRAARSGLDQARRRGRNRRCHGRSRRLRRGFCHRKGGWSDHWRLGLRRSRCSEQFRHRAIDVARRGDHVDASRAGCPGHRSDGRLCGQRGSRGRGHRTSDSPR